MDPIAAPPPPRSKGVLLWMLLSQLVTLLSFLPWAMILFFSTVAFNEAGSRDDWRPWAFVGTVSAYVPLALLCIIVAWGKWRRRRNVAATVWTTLPLLIAVPLLAYTLWVGLGQGGGGIEL